MKQSKIPDDFPIEIVGKAMEEAAKNSRRKIAVRIPIDLAWTLIAEVQQSRVLSLE